MKEYYYKAILESHEKVFDAIIKKCPDDATVKLLKGVKLSDSWLIEQANLASVEEINERIEG